MSGVVDEDVEVRGKRRGAVSEGTRPLADLSFASSWAKAFILMIQHETDDFERPLHITFDFSTAIDAALIASHCTFHHRWRTL